MKRTVLVTDDTGKEYEPTFEKRARGLCKKGRARWIGKDAICLASPPDHDFRKDSDMSENIIPAAPSMSADYILAQIEKIAEEPAYLREAIEKIADTDPEQSAAIASVVEAREATNRSLLDFYRHIYSDLNLQAHAMTVLEKASVTPNLPMGEVTCMLNKLLGFEDKK